MHADIQAQQRWQFRERHGVKWLHISTLGVIEGARLLALETSGNLEEIREGYLDFQKASLWIGVTA
jgi:hypothetical protein